jgi:serine/threonine protein kinase
VRAIKVLREDEPLPPNVTAQGFSNHFTREVKLVQKLTTSRSHAHLIEVYAADLDGNMPLIERDYAPGGSLAEHIQKARSRGKLMPISDVVKIGLEVADGLSILHAREVVHRNLKPSNILFDPLGTAKISDLYIAQVPAGLSMELQQVQALPIPGPVGYMCPEQIRGGHKLKPSADVYSLGAILFEALTGYSYGKLKAGIHVSELRSEVPKWLDELILQMLSRTADQRPYDGAIVAALLRADLDRLAGEPKEVAHAEGEYKPPESMEGAPKQFDQRPPGRQGVQRPLSGSFSVPAAQTKSAEGGIWQFFVNMLLTIVGHPVLLTFIAILLLIALWIFLKVVYQ